MEKKWFLAIDGKQVGPVADLAIENLLKNGRINGDTLVWKAGMDTWVQLGAVDALKAYLKMSAITPPPLPQQGQSQSGIQPHVKSDLSPTLSAPASSPIQIITKLIGKSGIDKNGINKLKGNATAAGNQLFVKLKAGRSTRYFKYAGFAITVIVGIWLVSWSMKGRSGSGVARKSSGGGIFESKEIKQVKSGTLGIDETVTIGNALDKYKYFTKTKWTSFKDDQERQVVEFNGVIDTETLKRECDEIYKVCPEEAVATFQFVLHPNSDTFELGHRGVKITCPNGSTSSYKDSTIGMFKPIIETIYANEQMIQSCYYC